MSLWKRFWAKVKMPADPYDCWLWMAATRNGYGVIGLGGRSDGIEYAHRYAYTEFYEPPTPGMDICHQCGNRRCVNPMHLYEGTRSENMKQAWRDGTGKVPDRWRPGSFIPNPNARIR